MSERNTFDGRTVLLAGAGCVAGAALASGFARAGARVIAIDRDEAAVLKMATRHPDRIDPLRLDCLDIQQTTLFADVWQDEPLHVLMHLQPLRHEDEMAGAIRSVLEFSKRLLPALIAGKGRVVILFHDVSGPAALDQRVFLPSLQRLSGTLQTEFAQAKIAVNAVCLSNRGDAKIMADLMRVAQWLCAPGRPPVTGSVLRLSAGGD